MAKSFLTNVDLNTNELQNAVIQNLASAPTGVEGRIYYDTTLNRIGFYDGGQWIYSDLSDVQGTLPITASINGSGVVTIAINPATTTTPGSMSAVHWNMLDDADSANTVGVLVIRDGSGNFAGNVVTTNTLNTTSGTIVNAPVSNTDIVNKAYVDGVAQNLDVKDSVRLATTPGDGDLDLTTGGLLTIDSVVTVAGDRVMVKNQTDASENGLYTVAVGAWLRTEDADTDAKVTAGLFTFIEEGTTNTDTGWVVVSNQPIVLDTTDVNFSQFSGAGTINGGAGLVKTGNTIDIVVPANSGLILNANDIAVEFASEAETKARTITNKVVNPGDLATFPRKYVETGVSIGGGASVNITHNLGTKAVVVSVMDETSFEDYETDIVKTTTSALTVTANGPNKTVTVTVIG